jgi:hypothetical protein
LEFGETEAAEASIAGCPVVAPERSGRDQCKRWAELTARVPTAGCERNPHDRRRIRRKAKSPQESCGWSALDVRRFPRPCGAGMSGPYACTRARRHLCFRPWYSTRAKGGHGAGPTLERRVKETQISCPKPDEKGHRSTAISVASTQVRHDLPLHERALSFSTTLWKVLLVSANAGSAPMRPPAMPWSN